MDFESNLPTLEVRHSKQESRTEDTLYLENVRGRLKSALKCGVPEIGAVIQTLKEAKSLQVEESIELVYHKLRRHAQALLAARRGNVMIVAHKPALEQLAAEQSVPFQASPMPWNE